MCVSMIIDGMMQHHLCTHSLVFQTARSVFRHILCVFEIWNPPLFLNEFDLAGESSEVFVLCASQSKIQTIVKKTRYRLMLVDCGLLIVLSPIVLSSSSSVIGSACFTFAVFLLHLSVSSSHCQEFA